MTPRERKILEQKAIQIKHSLYKFFPVVYHIWSRSNTFGYVYSTFPIEKKGGWIFRGGEVALAKYIKEKFNDPIIVFSNHLDKNYEVLDEKINDRNVLVINFHNFVKYYTIFGSSKPINLFFFHVSDEESEYWLRTLISNHFSLLINLIKDSPNLAEKTIKEMELHIEASTKKLELEKILRDEEASKFLIDQNPQLIEPLLKSIIKTIQTKPIRSEELKEIIKELPKLVSIYRKREHLEKIIDEFEELVNKQAKEREIQEFIFKNIWLLGDEYIPEDYQKEFEKQLKNKQRIDILLKRFDGHQDKVIVVELKRPKKSSKRYRCSEVPTSSVYDAISQGIKYVLEVYKEKGVMTKAIILVGSNEKNEWVEKINYFLHNVQVMTYYEIIENAKKRIKFWYDLKALEKI